MTEGPDSGGSPERYKRGLDAWHAFIEAWRTEVNPLQAQASQRLGFTVSYAQLGLRTALLLNGGGLVAAPAFAELLGSIWSQGFWPPIIAMGAFTLGLIAAAGATVLAFFEFLYARTVTEFEIARVAEDLNDRYEAAMRREPIPKRRTDPGDEERSAQRRAARWGGWAILLGLSSLVFFLIGAFFGGYILAGGGPPVSSGR